MLSNYRKIGKFVKQISTRNIDLSITDLKGININKEFMQSVANVNGTDLSKYRVVAKEQFAFNPMHVGRDEVLPISMLEQDEKVIVSPAYVVFEIIDKDELDPEYLMMWCRRPEFDRNAWFTTDNSVRGGFSWDDFCDMELPVPSIEKQREIVKEYNTIVNRIKLNEQLNQKLEETAQAIYKQWFIDHSNETIKLGDKFIAQKGKNITREQAVDGVYPVIAGGISPSCYHNKANTSAPVITISASGANAGFVNLHIEKVWSSDSSYIDSSVTNYVFFYYMFLKINQDKLMVMQTGTGQPHIYPEQIADLDIEAIEEDEMQKYENIVTPLFLKMHNNKKQNIALENFKNILLSSMASKQLEAVV